MIFSITQIQEASLQETPYAFHAQSPLRIGMTRKKGAPPDMGSGTPVANGVVIQEDGSLIFTMYAKEANDVQVKLARQQERIHLEKDEQGIFHASIPYDESLKGPIPVTFYVDGVEVLHPYAPMCFANTKMQNYIDIPDPVMENILQLSNIPHGSIHQEVYFAQSLQTWQRCLVYTPYGYREEKEYPVLYLQHGAGENETSWVHLGKVGYLMDHLLAEHACCEFLIVMNDGMVKMPHEQYVIDGFDGMEALLTSDCRSFIEQHYHVRKDKWGRAIAGLSLGSMLSSYLGCRHPELYGYVGLFSGFMRRRDHHPTYEDNPHLAIMKDKTQVEQEYHLYFRAMGEDDLHFSEFLEDDAFLSTYGIDQLPCYQRITYPGYAHTWACWRRSFCDFAKLLFK